MSVREYIGARYVPMFADPIAWDITKIYEPLTVVTNQGASYVSRREVPAGIQLSNTDYWILWADFNAQLQHYIDVVNTFDGRIDDLEDKFPIDTADIANSAITTAKIANSAITSAKIEDGTIATDDIANSAITSAKIANSAITTAKLNDGSVTKAKLANPINMLIFGDSFSTVGGSSVVKWWQIVAKRLGMQAKNYAVSGAGMIVPNNLIITQVNNAISDSAIDVDDIELILVYSGCNDCKTTYNISDIRTNQLTVASTIAENFPNARVIFAADNWPWARYIDSNLTYSLPLANQIAESMGSAAAANGLESYNTCSFLMPYNADSIYDNNHPNQAGMKFIAAMFMGLLGGKISPHITYGSKNITNECVISDSYTGTLGVAVNSDGGICINCTAYNNTNDNISITIPYCLPQFSMPLFTVAGDVGGWIVNTQNNPNVISVRKITTTGAATGVYTFRPFGFGD